MSRETLECSQDRDTWQEPREQEKGLGEKGGKASVKGKCFVLNAGRSHEDTELTGHLVLNITPGPVSRKNKLQDPAHLLRGLGIGREGKGCVKEFDGSLIRACLNWGFCCCKKTP